MVTVPIALHPGTAQTIAQVAAFAESQDDSGGDLTRAPNRPRPNPPGRFRRRTPPARLPGSRDLGARSWPPHLYQKVQNSMRGGGRQPQDGTSLITKVEIAGGTKGSEYVFMRTLLSNLARFWKDDSGQDLIEYTLLMAFIALASAAIFVSAGGSISSIWGVASNQLSNASSSAS